MKTAHVNILVAILFSATVVSFSYAGASCCDPGAGCCSTSNVSGGQQQLRSSAGGPSQTRVGTANRPAPRLNPMPWSATVNQIRTGRLAPASVSTGCCPGTNSTVGCCEIEPKSTLHSSPDRSMLPEMFAISPLLGTLW
jgi:hypothetical protein